MVEKVNRILGMLKRTFMSRDLGICKYFYVPLVRPHLDYAVLVWNPHLEGDIDRIEKVQRRATKMPFGFAKLEYEERFKRFNLTTLEDSQVRGDLIEMYKVHLN